MEVREPSGRPVRVGRRWLPWRPKLGRFDVVPDAPIFEGGDGIEGVVLGLLFTLLAPVVLLAAVFLGEVVLLLLLLPLVTMLRVARRHPWTVEVRSGNDLILTRRAPDWPSSTELIHELAQAAERGEFQGLPALSTGGSETGPVS